MLLHLDAPGRQGSGESVGAEKAFRGVGSPDPQGSVGRIRRGRALRSLLPSLTGSCPASSMRRLAPSCRDAHVPIEDGTDGERNRAACSSRRGGSLRIHSFTIGSITSPPVTKGSAATTRRFLGAFDAERDQTARPIGERAHDSSWMHSDSRRLPKWWMGRAYSRRPLPTTEVPLRCRSMITAHYSIAGIFARHRHQSGEASRAPSQEGDADATAPGQESREARVDTDGPLADRPARRRGGPCEATPRS